MSARLYLRLDGGPLQPGEFRNDNGAYFICCSGCGHTAPLPAHHTVHRGGVVSPIWGCANEACPVSEYLLLTEELM